MKKFIALPNQHGIVRHLVGADFRVNMTYARVAELVDALDLGSSVLRRGGSTPPSRTIQFVNALP